MSPSPRQRAQLESKKFREARERGWRKALENRTNGPKCGAKKRSAEGFCRQPVPEEGKRCRYHGGATPKGKQWHHRQPPKKDASEAQIRFKLKGFEIRDRKAEERRAAMSPDERAAHEQRRRAVQPKSALARYMERQARQSAVMLREIEEARSVATSAEKDALAARIAELERRAAELADRGLEDTEIDLPEVFK